MLRRLRPAGAYLSMDRRRFLSLGLRDASRPELELRLVLRECRRPRSLRSLLRLKRRASREDPLRPPLILPRARAGDLDRDRDTEEYRLERRSPRAGDGDESNLCLLRSLLGVRERDESLRVMDLSRSP